MSVIARPKIASPFDLPAIPGAFGPNICYMPSEEFGTAFPGPQLRPFIATLVPCPCGAAPSGVCFVGTKAQVWLAYPRLPRSNRLLSEISQAVCEHAGTPLLILLKGAGAALFEPQKIPQRILPLSAFDRFAPGCSLGLSLEQMKDLMKAEPKPPETFEAFVRRIICFA